MENEKEVPFEVVLQRLEGIVSQLEKGDVSLEDSLKAYEKGVQLVREAEKRLEGMELRIEELLSDGTKRPFKGEGPTLASQTDATS
jgi:exodeoxyribonuclease VII small subunit